MANRGELKTKLKNLRSWNADTDTAFDAELNRILDTTIKRLAKECPPALIPDTESVTLYVDSTSTSLARTINTSNDAYVFNLGAVAGGTTIPTDGTWDGIMHLEIQDLQGKWHRRQTREWWSQAIPGEKDPANCYFVSVTVKWPNTTEIGMAFRVVQPHFWLRDDVTQLVDGRVWDSNGQLLQVLPEGFARLVGDEDFQGAAKGRPLYFTRGKHFQMPAPQRAPTALPDPDIAPQVWINGSEPTGTFKYRYTYVWGKKDTEYLSPGGTQDPVWESSPSPESAAATAPSDRSQCIKLTNLVNIDWQQDFDPVVATARSSRTGWRKRIYRSRSTVTGGGTTEVNVEAGDVYYFLREVGGEVTTFTDDGTDIPDYFRRLPESHGYWAWTPAPHQDSQYTVDLRVYRRPGGLLNDSDAPPVHPDAEDMLLELGLYYLCLLDKQIEDAKFHLGEYDRLKGDWIAKDANPATTILAESWAPEVVPQRDPYRYGPFSST